MAHLAEFLETEDLAYILTDSKAFATKPTVLNCIEKKSNSCSLGVPATKSIDEDRQGIRDGGIPCPTQKHITSLIHWIFEDPQRLNPLSEKPWKEVHPG